MEGAEGAGDGASIDRHAVAPVPARFVRRYLIGGSAGADRRRRRGGGRQRCLPPSRRAWLSVRCRRAHQTPGGGEAVAYTPTGHSMVERRIDGLREAAPGSLHRRSPSPAGGPYTGLRGCRPAPRTTGALGRRTPTGTSSSPRWPMGRRSTSTGRVSVLPQRASRACEPATPPTPARGFGDRGPSGADDVSGGGREDAGIGRLPIRCDEILIVSRRCLEGATGDPPSWAAGDVTVRPRPPACGSRGSRGPPGARRSPGDRGTRPERPPLTTCRRR